MVGLYDGVAVSDTVMITPVEGSNFCVRRCAGHTGKVTCRDGKGIVVDLNNGRRVLASRIEVARIDTGMQDTENVAPVEKAVRPDGTLLWEEEYRLVRLSIPGEVIVRKGQWYRVVSSRIDKSSTPHKITTILDVV